MKDKIKILENQRLNPGKRYEHSSGEQRTG